MSMIAFLNNTLAQMNVETRQGAAPVARVPQAPAPPAAQPSPEKAAPARVDAVTGGTQPIARYFAAQMAPRPKDTASD
jgi:hypothetical protein